MLLMKHNSQVHAQCDLLSRTLMLHFALHPSPGVRVKGGRGGGGGEGYKITWGGEQTRGGGVVAPRALTGSPPPHLSSITLQKQNEIPFMAVRAAARCPCSIILLQQDVMPFHKSEGCSRMPLQHHSAETTCDIVHGSEGVASCPCKGILLQPSPP